MREFLTKYRQPLKLAAVFGLAGLLLIAAFSLAIRAQRPKTLVIAQPRAGVAPTEAYKGLGTWVDLWDARAWNDPKSAVADMASHGVKTIYVQTASSHSTGGIANRGALSTFITEAHARHMYVVGWYLPSFKADGVDLQRCLQAVRFTTTDGQQCDSFALDIESTTVKSLATRNRRLADLSNKLRTAVGTGYPLGGIIPAPVGLAKQTGFWDVFPYATVAKYYDVVLPMAYYTYHGHGAASAYADASKNLSLLRAQPGCANVPVHLIGGIASKSTVGEAKQFAASASTTGCIGLSLYDWVGTNTAKWQALSAGWAASN